MQEEVENRTVNLAISTTKLTFRTIVNGYNAWKRHHQAKVAQKTAQLPVGKQSIKELIGQNQGVSSIQRFKTVCGMSGDLSCSLTWSLTKFF